MHSTPKSSSDAAMDILQTMVDETTEEEFDEVGGWWDWFPLPQYCYTPWHQLPLARHAPVPRFLPVSRFYQVVFAEAFRQTLTEGFPLPRAIELAAEVNSCPWFRRALVLMRSGVCTGHSLAWSLQASGAWVGRALPAALEVGEEFGCLPDALAAFVRQAPRFSGPRFRRAVGRRPACTRFAVALARLLRDHPLTYQVVRAAGELSGGSRRFVANVHAIAGAMENGVPFAMALGRFPRDFDTLFRAFLDRMECREEMAACLERLAVAGDRVQVPGA